MWFKSVFIAGSLFLSSSCDQLGISNPATDNQLKKITKNQQTIIAKLTNLEKQVISLIARSRAQPGNKQAPKSNPNKVYNVEIGDSYVHGNKDAPITIIKWLDYQCPYCARSVTLVDEIAKKYPNKVKFVFKNFPLPFHKQAKTAAMYSLAAQNQGKYMEMYHKIFENYKNLKSNKDYPLEIAKELGLDIEKLKKDMKDPSLEKRIEKEMAQLRNSGIPRMSVPKFLINGKEPSGRDVNAWSQIIDSELRKMAKNNSKK